MGQFPSLPTDVYLDPRLNPGVVLTLEVGLREVGCRIVNAPALTALSILPQEALSGDPSPGPRIVLVEKGPTPESLATAFDRKPPPLLVACRGPGGAIAPWEAQLLFAVLGNDALVPPSKTAKVFELRQRSDIDAAAEQTLEFVKQNGGSYLAGSAADVIHEISANALLDAPADADGSPRYAHQRSSATIRPEDAARARVVIGDEAVYLQAADRFGRLTPSPIAKALKQVGGFARLSTEGGGAGLGLVRILDQSDWVSFRVAAGKRSEVTSVMTLENLRRRTSRPKSVVYLNA